MILNLKDAKTWDLIISDTLKNTLGTSYVGILIENAEKIKYRDSEEEACSLFTHKIPRSELTELIMHNISTRFKYVIAYHGCRTYQLDSYYKNGIIPLCPSDVQKKFRYQFKYYATEDEIAQAISAVSIETREGVVHTVLDDRVFYESSGHYLIYGGEYLHCLAVHLPGDTESRRDILKKVGRATVFVCQLPFSVISDLECLSQFMMADHFFRVAHQKDDVFILDYTIFMTDRISPELIIDHYHPKLIPDPFKNYALWNDEMMNYEQPNKALHSGR